MCATARATARATANAQRHKFGSLPEFDQLLILCALGGKPLHP
jgi:hypothetical protein